MKKILLLSAVILGAGAATASQAGVHFSIGIPLPVPPAVVVAPPAPVCVQPPVQAYVPPPVVYAPAPPVVVAPPVITFGFGGHPSYYRPYPYHPYYRAPYYGHHDGHRW